MHELINLNLCDDTIESMLDLYPELRSITDKQLLEKKSILLIIGCNLDEINNIIGSNPLYLDRTNDEIISLIESLIKNGFTDLNLLIESNPYILNLESFEIEDYILKRINSGEEKEEIIDDLETNPYLFNEM